MSHASVTRSHDDAGRRRCADVSHVEVARIARVVAVDSERRPELICIANARL